MPALILRYPFAAGWANFVLDSIDGDILVPAGLHEPTYQLVDKLADYVTYIFIAIWGWRTPIKKAVVATFLLRTIGQMLFFATRNELAFFFFPNLLEPLFLTYVTIARLRGKEHVESIYTRHRTLIWILIGLYKFQDEWFTHVGNVDRSEFVQGLFGG